MMHWTRNEFQKRRTVILYGLIGITAVGVDVGFFVLFYNFFALSPIISTVLSVTIAMVYAFTLNAVYNFKVKDFIHERFASYALVSVLGMGASVFIIKFLTMFEVDANLAKLVSLPPIVVLQYLINKGITFREMRRGEGAVATVAAPAPAGAGRSVAIIGGGFTGLTAAYELAKLGHQVTVYEAEATLGGLVAGFELDGLPLERAYHFLYKTDTDIITLAKEIGVDDTLHFYSSSVSLFYEGKLYPFMTPKDLLSFTPLSFINRIRAGVVALYLGKVKKWEPFAQVPAYAWMQKWAGAQVTKVIWEPVLRGKFFDYYDKIAMSYLWGRVAVRVNSKDKGDVTEKLGYFDGGFQTFTNRLVERCEELGVTFKTSTRPTALVERAGRAIVQVGVEHYVYDAVLSTTPSHVFHTLINHDQHTVSAEYLARLTTIPYLGAALLIFTTDEKLTDYYWHNVNDLTQPFLVLLSLDALVGTDKLHGKHVYYVGAYVPHEHEYFTLTDEQLVDRWVPGIQALFPHFTKDMMTAEQVFRFKNAQHVVEPGYEALIIPYQSELPSIYVANFTQIFPEDRGTNYAVREGVKVAQLIHTDLARRSAGGV